MFRGWRINPETRIFVYLEQVFQLEERSWMNCTSIYVETAMKRKQKNGRKKKKSHQREIGDDLPSACLTLIASQTLKD